MEAKCPAGRFAPAGAAASVDHATRLDAGRVISARGVVDGRDQDGVAAELGGLLAGIGDQSGGRAVFGEGPPLDDLEYADVPVRARRRRDDEYLD